MTPYPKTFSHWLQRCSVWSGAALITLAVSGCAMVGGVANVVASSTANLFSGTPGPSFLDWKALTLVAAPDVNQNSPLALDLVFVRDQATLEKLRSLPAAKWFSSKNELQLSSNPTAELTPTPLAARPKPNCNSSSAVLYVVLTGAQQMNHEDGPKCESVLRTGHRHV